MPCRARGVPSESVRISEEHAALRVDLAGLEERRRSEQAARMRVENQVRDIAHRRQELTKEMERLGLRRRGCCLTTSNWIPGRRILAEQISLSESAVARMAAKETELRSALAALEDYLQARPHGSAGGQRKAFADRTGACETPGRTEVPGRDVPEGTNASLEELSADRRNRPGRGRPRGSRTALPGSAVADRSAGPGEHAGAAGI